MLRIPLPEYDGFALREACKGLPVWFSTGEHVMHATSHGHISVLC